MRQSGGRRGLRFRCRGGVFRRVLDIVELQVRQRAGDRIGGGRIGQLTALWDPGDAEVGLILARARGRVPRAVGRFDGEFLDLFLLDVQEVLVEPAAWVGIDAQCRRR